MMLPRLSIQMKMLSVLGGGLLGFVIYFGVNHVILQKNRDTLQQIVSQKLPSLQLSESLITEIAKLREVLGQVILTQNLDGIGRADESNKKITEYFVTWAREAYLQAKEVEKLQADYRASYKNAADLMQNTVAGIVTIADARADFQREIAALNLVEKNFGEVKINIGKDLENSVNEAVALGKSAMYFGIALMIVGFLLCAVFYFIVTQINDGLIKTNNGIQDISKQLHEMVQEAQVSSQSLRTSANKQASSSTETVISMEQMKRILAQTSRSSNDARDLSDASLTEATSGKDLVQSLKDSMSDIENSNKDLQEVTEVVKLVREHTRIINEIVFKTQLLSFNANIEAARAGQHGLGFAVVANEIGNLAEMSGRAAEEINELLEKSTTKVDLTIGSTKSKVAKANELTGRCYDFFTVITERSGQLKQMVGTITQATTEQTTGVEYVVEAMSDLSHTASETDRMAQGLSKLADGLKHQSMSLNHAVDNLNALVRGGESVNSLDNETHQINDLKDNNLRQSA